VVTVYDAATLRPLGDEIQIPAERAEYFPAWRRNALSDDGRFMAVFNLTPADLRLDRGREGAALHGACRDPRVQASSTPPARAASSCCARTGAALSVLLDDEGGTARLERSEPFFDPQKDPVTEKAVRRGNEWLFVSFEGVVYPVDVSGEKPRFGETLVAGRRRGPARLVAYRGWPAPRRARRLRPALRPHAPGRPDTHKAPAARSGL